MSYFARNGKNANSAILVNVVPDDFNNENNIPEEILRILKCNGIKGVSGKFVSALDFDFDEFKKVCQAEGIEISFLECTMDFSEFKLNEDGLIPVIVQHYKTSEVLMLAYMNEEAYNMTLETGKMTYYSRSRNEIWVKGLTSGHFQYVESLYLDCDKPDGGGIPQNEDWFCADGERREDEAALQD